MRIPCGKITGHVMILRKKIDFSQNKIYFSKKNSFEKLEDQKEDH